MINSTSPLSIELRRRLGVASPKTITPITIIVVWSTIYTIGKRYSLHLCPVVVVSTDNTIDIKSGAIHICIPWRICICIISFSQVEHDISLNIRTTQLHICCECRILEYLYLEVTISILDTKLIGIVLDHLDHIGTKCCISTEVKLE
jgi:hypothetical protein